MKILEGDHWVFSEGDQALEIEYKKKYYSIYLNRTQINDIREIAGEDPLEERNDDIEY